MLADVVRASAGLLCTAALVVRAPGAEAGAADASVVLAVATARATDFLIVAARDAAALARAGLLETGAALEVLLPESVLAGVAWPTSAALMPRAVAAAPAAAAPAPILPNVRVSAALLTALPAAALLAQVATDAPFLYDVVVVPAPVFVAAPALERAAAEAPKAKRKR